ncbi:MAG TPA: SBBP repeat-containing protein [Acidimicrobiales bacterium]|nr:SBBP repeat-containing protein [Acidimicrobiales bacterium]
MNDRRTRRALCWAVVAGFLPLVSVPVAAAAQVSPGDGAPPAGDAARAAARSAFAHLPVRFEANQGQADPAARFVARAGGAVVYLTDAGAVFTVPQPHHDHDAAPDRAPTPAPPAVVRLGLAGARAHPAVSTAERLPGVSNYLVGDDESRWHTGVPSYAGVRYTGVYPGVDLVFHGGNGGLEYDFDVAPGADPGRIALTLGGGDRPVVEGGDLVVRAGGAVVRQHAPVVYQAVNGRRRTVEAAFAPRPDGSIGFALGAYDDRSPLVIDPVVTYSTYLGGSGDDGVDGIALGASGNAYLTGFTSSTNFPVTAGAYQTGCTTCNNMGNGHASFVAELNATGTALVYATYLAGTTGTSQGDGAAVDASGNAYVAGYTSATDFPTANGFRTTNAGADDAFVAKLGPTGSTLLYGSYVGGTSFDEGRSVALGATGVVYLAGTTNSTDLIPTGPGAPASPPYQAGAGGGFDAFLVKVDTTVSGAGSLRYATYLGGSQRDTGPAVAVDPTSANVAYLGGDTQSTNFPTTAGAYQTALTGTTSGFVARIDTIAGTSGLGYATYLGGASGDSHANGLVARGGLAYVTGSTTSASYPVKNALQASFAGTFGSNVTLTEMDTSQSGTSSLVYSTYLGGTGPDAGYGIAVDAAGKVVLTGQAASGFPLKNPVQVGAGAFAAQVDPAAGTSGLVYSTVLGENNDTGYAVAVDGATPSSAFVAGVTTSPAFPTTAGAFEATAPAAAVNGNDHGFVAKLAAGAQPYVGGLSVHSGLFSGGTTVVVTGGGFTGATAVSFGAVPAASFHVDSDTQITAVSPCAAPSGTICPESALATVAASTKDVRVTAGPVASLPSAADRFVFGEGSFAGAASCTMCSAGNHRASVALPGGKVLSTATYGQPYTDGSTVLGSNLFTSATGQHTFTAADVGKRLSAGAAGTPVFPPGTTITSIANANTARLSANAASTQALAGWDLSLNDTEVYDPATDSWSPAGACNQCGQPDANQGGVTLTVLGNGKVLAAGGLDPTAYTGSPARAIAQSFLFDPATSAWSATGSLTTPRKGATATLLANGKVLVAGGSNTGAVPAYNLDPTAGAEVYDPVAGTFSATAPMSTARANAAAAVLPSGKVLVAGGYLAGTGSAAPATASAEQYDPASATWSPAGSMGTPRVRHTLTALATTGACGANCGKVVVANGVSCYVDCPPAAPAQPALTSAELYTPGSPGSWVYTGLTVSRGMPSAAVLLPNGNVLKTGGEAGAKVTAESYDPADGTWKSAGTASFTSVDCCETLLAAGPQAVCAANCGKVFFVANSAAYYYTPRPAVSALSPSSGPPGTTVTLTGTGLTTVGAVSFAGVAATGVTHSSASPDTTLTMVVPSGPSGPVAALATGPGGTSSLAGPAFAFPGVPSAVVNLAAAAANTSAVLTWSPPASDGGTAITSYGVVTNAPANGATHATFTVAPCSPTCSTTVTGLSNSLGIAGQGAYSFTVYATNANGNGMPASSAPVYPQATAGEFSALAPARILDTRSGVSTGTCFSTTGSSQACATIGAGGTEQIQVTGAGGVPASGVSAVVMNVTVTNPTAASVLTVWPSDAAQPGVSNLNYTPAQTVPNLVTVKLGADGRVRVNNAFGSVDVVADVVGWYSAGTTVAGSRYVALSPARILDTRSGVNTGTCVPSPCATLGAGGNPETIDVTVAGAGGVPSSGATAVVLNATVTNPSTASVLTVFPSDVAQPLASNLNYTGGQTVPNLVIVKLGADGKVKIDNAFGSADVIFDVVGWYTTAGSIAGSRFSPLTPARIVDTRSGVNTGTCVPSPCATLGAASYPETTAVSVAGAGGVPATGAAGVVANTTVTNPSTPSVLTLFPSDVSQPTASNLNYTGGQTVPNLVAVKLGADGKVKVNNAFGTVDVIMDVDGWFNDGTS